MPRLAEVLLVPEVRKAHSAFMTSLAGNLAKEVPAIRAKPDTIVRPMAASLTLHLECQGIPSGIPSEYRAGATRVRIALGSPFFNPLGSRV